MLGVGVSNEVRARQRPGLCDGRRGWVAEHVSQSQTRCPVRLSWALVPCASQRACAN